MSSTITLPRPASVRRQGWRDRAACLGADPELFFPEAGGAGKAAAAKAKAICATCPVTAPCLRFALESPEESGTWGGVPERDRRGAESPDTGPVLCGNSLHVMDEENTYVNPAGGKVCRACRASADRERRQETKYEREQGIAA
jgi:WhiB family redox-sensing transcriptional regulator